MSPAPTDEAKYKEQAEANRSRWRLEGHDKEEESPREERRRLFELEQGPARLTPLGERLVGLAAW